LGAELQRSEEKTNQQVDQYPLEFRYDAFVHIFMSASFYNYRLQLVFSWYLLSTGPYHYSAFKCPDLHDLGAFCFMRMIPAAF
jgi:hypothetical protein